VVDCLDNAASRLVLQGAVRAKGIPCLHGALSADGQFGRVVWDEHFVIDSENVAGQATCQDGEHVPFIGLVAATLAGAVQRFVADGTKVSTNLHPGGMVRIA
jgi:molybdopterin-synthase adenylyltransferase